MREVDTAVQEKARTKIAELVAENEELRRLLKDAENRLIYEQDRARRLTEAE